MSTFIEFLVTCRECGATESRSVATSVNVTRAPQYRAEILEGTFQRCVCAFCGVETTPVHPFVYIDFERRHLFGVFALEEAERWALHEAEVVSAFEGNLGADGPPVAQALGEGMALRVVFGLNALREKLVAFDAGLDDAVVEAVKLRIMLTGAAEPSDVLTLSRVDEELLRFVVMRDAHEQECVYPIDVARALYDELASDPVVVSEVVGRLSRGAFRDARRLLDVNAG